MTNATRSAEYQMRGFELFAEGKRLPVSHRAVRLSVRLWQEEPGRLVTWIGGVARIEKPLALSIIETERLLTMFRIIDGLCAAA